VKDDEKFFWSRFKKEGACLLWTGRLSENKYGYVFFRGKKHLTHRVAWELRHGGIRDGLWVLHSLECKNKHCAADNHLRLGTPKENTVDSVMAGTQPSLSFPGEANGRSKLTEKQVALIRNPATVPRDFKKLAVLWGVSFSLLYRIRKGLRWKSSKSFTNLPPSNAGANRKSNTPQNPNTKPK
jgi:hypothetical protein